MSSPFLSYSFEAYLKDANIDTSSTPKESYKPFRISFIFAGLFRLLFDVISYTFGNHANNDLAPYDFESWLKNTSVVAGTQKQNENIQEAPDKYPARSQKILILVGTEYGFCYSVAMRLSNAIGDLQNIENCSRSYNVVVKDMEIFETTPENKIHFFLGLKSKHTAAVFIVCSTQGDGVPPTGARRMHELLKKDAYNSASDRKMLRNLNYAVLAPGDKNYPRFAQCGKDFDEYLKLCGGRQLLPRQDLDQEDPIIVDKWISEACEAVRTQVFSSSDSLDRDEAFQRDVGADEEELEDENFTCPRKPGFHQLAPILCEVLINKPLCEIPDTGDSESVTGDSRQRLNLDFCEATPKAVALSKFKQVYHIEFDVDPLKKTLPDMQKLLYEPGCALGFWPMNNPDEVTEIINSCGFTGQESMSISDSIRRRIPPAILAVFEQSQLSDDKFDHSSMSPVNINVSLSNALKYLHDIRSLDETAVGLFEKTTATKPSQPLHLLHFAKMVKTITKRELLNIIGTLKPLLPRLYSISSSSLASPERLSITASLVHYIDQDAVYKHGTATGHFAGGLAPGDTASIYLHKNNDFYLPQDLLKPLIMIGPGTGFSPFRAFLQHREHQLRHTGISLRAAKHLLFYGCRDNLDYIYKEEIERWESEGLITKLFLAMSRSGPKKIYVQHLMEKESDLIWSYLQMGCHIYVCGDAKEMAPQVHETLLRIITSRTNMRREKADATLSVLADEGRYQRDIW